MRHSDSPVAILWRRLDLPGHEYAELWRESYGPSHGWALRGTVLVAHAGRPYHLEYAIHCDAAWRTQRVAVTGSVKGAPLALELARGEDGRWRADGGECPELAGCVDVDLAFSPSTNLLPIRRLGLAVGAHADVRAAWVRFPALTVEVLEQRYTRTGPATYRYESADGAFRRELTVNEAGFPVDYPDFWRAET